MLDTGAQDPAPLEYSIEWLTCAFASRPDVVMVGLAVLLEIVYLLTCRVLGLAVLVRREDQNQGWARVRDDTPPPHHQPSGHHPGGASIREEKKPNRGQFRSGSGRSTG